MITPDSSTPSAEASASGSSHKIKLPLAALAVEGTSPAEGDEVSFTVRGRLSSVSGESGEIEITSINDEPLPEAAMPEKSEDEMALDAARKADGDNY